MGVSLGPMVCRHRVGQPDDARGWSNSGRRNERRYPGIWLNHDHLGLGQPWLVTAFALFAVVQGTEKWYQPQYAIPLMGMVLGNTLNGISLGAEHIHRILGHPSRSGGIAAWPWERRAGKRPAAPIQHAVRTGMIPIINCMMVVGIVSLPGMMTGQLLSGTAPFEAVKYQIVIMFLIASATALGTVAIVPA